MKIRVASISFLVAVLFLPAIALAQEQRNDTPTERKPIDWFYIDANHRPKTLLLKLVQFTAPYPGGYLHTVVTTNGHAYSTHVVPNWAHQDSRYAELNDALLAQLKQLLADIKVPSTQAVFEPLGGYRHSIFVFHNGSDFVQWNYNGPNPPQIDAILAILQKEFLANAEAEREKFAAHQKRIRETYGDWENRPGITLNGGSAMHLCEGNRAVVVWTAGMRKTVATSPPVVVSAYHALIFSADWLPTVSQLNEVFAEQATPQTSLDRFKAVLKDDAAVQKLELH